MSRQEHLLASFNRGRVSPLGMGRVDVKRIAMSAETQTNWIPRVLGSMSLRPGLQYLGATKSNAACRMVPFIFSATDTSLLEFTDSFVRFWKSDALITRVTATSTVPAFSTPWTDSDEAGATSTLVGTTYEFVGTGTNAAIRDTAVTTLSTGIQHAVRIVVSRGPMYVRIGSSLGDDSYLNETLLRTGTHSLTFIPIVTPYYIRLFSRTIPKSIVTSCQIEAAGTLSLPSPYLAANLSDIRTDQSAEVVFVACDGFQQRMIERRDNDSWSIVLYQPEDGPFGNINTSAVTLTGSAITGNITVTASKATFRAGHVGALFQMISEGQSVQSDIAAQNTFTDPILVQGIGTDRTFTINLSVTPTFAWAAGSTVVLQRSIGAVGSWSDVTGKSWTAVTVETYADGLDNQIVYYRLGIKTGAYTGPDSVRCALSIATGSDVGVVRVTAFTSETLVDAEVLATLGGTNSTDLWREGIWSDVNGWPSSVALHEGRMWWCGQSKIIGSISDAYDSFDGNVEGDSGVISRSIGSGPVDTLQWMASNQRLLIGSEGNEFSARSSSLDEPLSPTAFTIKPTSSQGSASVDAVKIDNRCFFVQRNGSRVYELSFDQRWYDYSAKDITTIIPEIGYPSIARMGVQRQPDTRIHCVRSDGTVAMHVQEQNEDMAAWIDIETDGLIEDVVVLPGGNGELDDYVYYVVKRTINGATVRYLEKWAQSLDCEGGTLNKQADSFVIYDGSNLTHLEGESVVVWYNGEDIGTQDDYTQTYSVSGGTLTPSVFATGGVVGLPYTGTFKSMKIGSPSQFIPQVLNHYKVVNHIGLIMANTHRKGLRFGPDFTTMDSLPDIESGIPLGLVTSDMYTAYDQQPIEFPGGWDTDSRVCLLAQAPRPVTLLALDLDLEIE